MAEAMEEAAAAPARTPDRMRRNRLIGFALALAVFAADQASKWIAIYILQLPERQEIIWTDFFSFRWNKNSGVSMGFLVADTDFKRWLLVAMTGAIAAFV